MVLLNIVVHDDSLAGHAQANDQGYTLTVKFLLFKWASYPTEGIDYSITSKLEYITNPVNRIVNSLLGTEDMVLTSHAWG